MGGGAGGGAEVDLLAGVGIGTGSFAGVAVGTYRPASPASEVDSVASSDEESETIVRRFAAAGPAPFPLATTAIFDEDIWSSTAEVLRKSASLPPQI
jgi:hypothetical protein